MNQPKKTTEKLDVNFSKLEKLLNRSQAQSPLRTKEKKFERDLHLLFDRIESILLREASVKDCKLLLKETKSGDRELIAYVVSANSFAPEQLQSCLREYIPESVLPKAYVPVSNLPLTDTGEIDEQKLMSLEVIDSELIRDWEEKLNSIEEIERAAVIVREDTDKLSNLHLADLLTNWQKDRNRSIEPTKQVLKSIDSESTEKKKPAICHGKSLQLAADAPQNLAEVLLKAAKQDEAKGIIYIGGDGSQISQSYAELLETASKILASLQNLGLKPQDKVILQLEHNRDFIEAFWACILGGFVPVPISIASNYEPCNSYAKKLVNAWEKLENPLVLTSNSLAPQISNLVDRLDLENFPIKTVDNLRQCQGVKDYYQARSEDLALLLLTSGSTGTPKGVMLTHGNIITNISASAQFNNFTKEDISLNWLRLDHVGSLVRCSIRDIYVGSQQIHAPAELFLQDPLRLLDWIEQYRVTYAWCPNFALGLINDRADEIKQRQWDLSSLKSMLSVAEAIVPKTAKRFAELLTPHGLTPTVMHSAWGMSETCAAVTFSHRYLLELSDDDSYVEVGAPTPGLSMRIVDELRRVVSEETVGSLQIKGGAIVSSYYQNPELNREAFTEDGWLKTGDLGFIRQGRLTVTGREKDIIIINGLNHYSHEIEAVVEEVEGVEVSYTAACALRNAGKDTDRLVIFFHTAITDCDRKVELIKQIQTKIVRQIGISASYLIPVAKEIIPKTAIGKIQRSQLVERFQAGEFEEIVKDIDRLLENENTIPDWFYRKIWRRKEAVIHDRQSTEGLTLVFLDSFGLGERLCSELKNNERSYIKVEMGEGFARLNGDRYKINPTNPQDYQQLIEEVTRRNLSIDRIVHLWTYDREIAEITSIEELEAAQEKGIYSLLFLVQALCEIGKNSNRKLRLQVVSSNSQPTSKERAIATEKAPILGLVKTIPQEMPWIDCRHLDLSSENIEDDGDRILKELQVVQLEQEVAYYKGERFIPRLVKAHLPQETKQEMPFKRGGMYLLSGGLGEIGIEIAKYLLQHYQARLLLVGRTALPPKHTWEEYLQREDAVSRRIKAYRELEEFEGEIAYEVVDICDLTKLNTIVDRASSNWNCELDGVVHLARVTQEYLLTEETAETMTKMLRPKVLGTWVLHQLIKDKQDAVFINFSSVSSIFGTYRMGAYAAANRFLDSFSHYQRNNSLRSYSFAWSIWEEVGLNRNYQMRDVSRARGYYTILNKQGLNSLLAGLHLDSNNLIVGLDGNNSYLRSQVEPEFLATQSLSAYVTIKNESIAELPELEIRDRFGTLIHCKLKVLAEIPLTESGAIDRTKLAAPKALATAKQTSPRNELENILVSIWQEVLGVKAIGIDDNFLQLGGDSIKAAILINKLQEKIATNIEFVTLFQAPTVAELAALLQQKDPETLGKLNNQQQLQNQIEAIAPVSWGNANRLLKRIEKLGDREIDSLLDRLLSEQKQKRNLVAQLLQEKATQPNVFTLSFSQQRMWLLHQLEP
ncbi:MAG: AMP-binding protein, partial [Xenococcaceae cyanobacterium]